MFSFNYSYYTFNFYKERESGGEEVLVNEA